MAPMRTLPVVWSTETVRRPGTLRRSTSIGGAARPAFMSGTRSWPPASSRAPGCSPSEASASSRLAAAV